MASTCGWSSAGRTSILEFCSARANRSCIRTSCNITWNDCASNVAIHTWFISPMEHASLKIIRASLVRLNILIKSTVGPTVRRAFRVKNGGPITTPRERIKAARDSVACFIGGSTEPGPNAWSGYGNPEWSLLEKPSDHILNLAAILWIFLPPRE